MKHFLDEITPEYPTLFRIPDPPESYKEFKSFLSRHSGSPDYSQYLNRFYNKFPRAEKEISSYLPTLQRIRILNMELLNQRNPHFFHLYPTKGEGIQPIERIERREGDGKFHGKVWTMLIFDFDFIFKKDQFETRKIYIPLGEGD